MAAQKKEPKLHEVLAVESDLESQSSKIMMEATSTFTKKAPHFMAHHKWLEMFDEGRKLEEQGATEHKDIVETVDGKLGHVWGHFGRYLNTIAQKERTNQDARADLIVEGEVLIEDAPATLLLGLESRLKKLREVYNAIPTFSPGIKWEPDPNRGKGIYKAEHLQTANKTEKVPRHKVLVEPTKEHPAQIEKWMENVAVGVFKAENWTSMVSPAKKAEWIGRIDTLLRSVKKARQRANNTPLVKVKISEPLRKFIHQKD